MADFGTPVAAQVNPAQGLQTLGSFLDVQNAQLGIQQRKQQLQGGAAIVQQEQQKNNELAQVQGLLQKTKAGAYATADGTLDRQRLADDIAAVGPYAQETANTVLAQANAISTNRATLQKLSTDQNAQVSGILKGIAGMSNPTHEDLLDAVGQARTNNHDPMFNRALDNLLSGFDTKWTGDELRNRAGNAASYIEGFARQKPITVETPGTSQPATQDVFSGDVKTVGAPFIKGAPAGYVFDPVTKGFVYEPAIAGGRAGRAGAPAPAATQPANRPPQPGAGTASGGSGIQTITSRAPGEATQYETNQSKITENRQLAQDALTQRDILNRIQGLSQSGVYTGPGSQAVADLATALGQVKGFEGAAQYANNYNELLKFIAQNYARQGPQLGLQGSDARLDAAVHTQPNAAMDPRTIRGVAEYVNGLVRMQQGKTQAMEDFLSKNGRNGVANEHQFEKDWRENADPRLFQMAEMQDQNKAQDYARLHINKAEIPGLQAKHEWLVQHGVLPASTPTPNAPSAATPTPVYHSTGASGAY